MVVRTVISDVNRHTNRVTATYVLEGGTTDEQWELSSEVDQDGEDAYFRAQFELR
ncbi:hypothetical protein [Candidatus Palauibacter sp.]|uniref:hypothetical protein n=1 Tax=Candidatus Palauibacter sp. TaxID=3101350 RepID=UPI003AF29095